jgi:hypothetical protein
LNLSGLLTIARFVRCPSPFSRQRKSFLREPLGGVFDDAIKKLAPTVSHLQAGECPAIHELADYLNSLGLVAPSGGPFTYTTTRRVLIRLAEMGLCLAPMTLSETKGRLRRKKTALKAMVFQKYEK